MQCEGRLGVGAGRLGPVPFARGRTPAAPPSPALAACRAAARGLCRPADQRGRGPERDSPHLGVEV